ncbi:pyridoxine 5'-phosphate oxidase C-terminal domain-containing protein [Nocardia sp. MW-W600-9]
MAGLPFPTSSRTSTRTRHRRHRTSCSAPVEAEFWQASHDRRHLRLRYRRADDTWVRERLWP